MIHSFRLRLAVLSSLLCGIALAAFGLSAWWLVRGLKIDRLDSDARSNAEREVSRTRSPAEWAHIESNLVSSLGVRESNALLLLVLDADGQTVYRTARWPADLAGSSLPWPKPRIPARPIANVPQPGTPPVSIVVVRKADGHRWHIGLASTGSEAIAIALDAQIIEAEMRGIRNAFLVAIPLALMLIGAGAWAFSGRALRPLHTLTSATQRVNAQALDQRIASRGEDDEFVTLIELFNRMLERLERSFQQAHRFSADAAHELKTPLAILQGQVERALHAADDGSPMQIELTGILDEVRRLTAITSKLLLLSQADAGHLKLHREPFDLTHAMTELEEDVRMLAPHLRVSGEYGSGMVLDADGALLQQVLHNFISNAIKYNLPDGWIRISAGAVPQGLQVSVSNSSAGIPAADCGRIFERFYRADPARNHSVAGAGLGLSVSREIARAHGGDITVRVADDGSVEFRMTLPTSSALAP